MSEVKKGDLMGHVKNLEKMAKSQLFHTSGDSSVSNWAGSAHTDQNEWENGIDDAGTDYDGVKKALADKVRKSQALTPAEVAIAENKDPRPAIAAKVSKGQDLTPVELWALKGGVKMMGLEDTVKGGGDDAPGKALPVGKQDSASAAPDTNAGNKEDDETEPDAKKSFSTALSKSEHAQRGVEVSPFLAAFTQAFAAGLEGMQARIVKSIEALASQVGTVESRVSGVEAAFSKSLDFSKATAETLVALGEAAAHNEGQAILNKSMPVGAPKSLVQTSGMPTPDPLSPLQKSQIVDHMCNMVIKGLLPSAEVVKYETANEMTPEVRARVADYLSGGTR